MTDRLLPHDAALERLKALHPKKIDLSLGRMRRLCAALGHPERKLPPVIHVAGTNGKGSTVAFLRAMAEAAGLRVHAYTSPHLVRFAERIRLAGTLISDEALAKAVDRVEAANAGQPITFFEVTTATAFQAFSEVEADLCLLEVGLGGALDATNVIDRPAVAVITPVDLDHREFLGSTIEQVAAEKAGIIKPGGRVVVARQSPNAQAVIEAQADRQDATLTVMGVDFDAWAERDGMAVQTGDGLLDLPAPSLLGPHQFGNAGVAAMAALALGDRRLTDAAIAEGVRSATWPARMQRLTRGPLGARAAAAGADLILDGGHNPHAARALAEALERLSARDGRLLRLVTGLLGNKDALAFFGAFTSLKPQVFTVPFASETAATPEALARTARLVGLDATACPDVDTALEGALQTPGARVVICGSLYLAGEVLARSPETWPA